MKKNLLAMVVFMTSLSCALAQQNPVVIDSVTVPIKQQLETLLRNLNKAEITSGLLEEKSVTPLSPSYFNDNLVKFSLPSSSKSQLQKDISKFSKTISKDQNK